MDIKVLGPGCAKCHKLEQVVNEVVQEMGIDTHVEKISDMKKIMEYDILMTPGLVINKQVVVSGKVPDKAEVTKYIVNALAKDETRT